MGERADAIPTAIDLVAAMTAYAQEHERARQELQRELHEATRQLRELQRREASMVRLAYRKGYQAGRGSMRRGAPPALAPELNARGELKAVIEHGG